MNTKNVEIATTKTTYGTEINRLCKRLKPLDHGKQWKGKTDHKDTETENIMGKNHVADVEDE